MSATRTDPAGTRDRLHGLVAVVTGGSGGLGSVISETLADAGARVAVAGRRLDAAEAVAARIRENRGEARAVACDVTEPGSLGEARERVHELFGPVDILVNGAGGNHPHATTSEDRGFFDLDADALRHVVDLNLLGTLLACQVFGRDMAERGTGVIINVSSMAAERPLTRVVGYAAAKAAVNNLTRWLAVYLARTYGPGIRVNALAPGFFLTQQNQYLMVDAETGALTSRGATIVDHTPMGRLGAAQDLAGTLLWLADPDNGFVTGVVVPVDGGFSAFSGV